MPRTMTEEREAQYRGDPKKHSLFSELVIELDAERAESQRLQLENEELLESIRTRKWLEGIPTRRHFDEAWIQKTERLQSRVEALEGALKPFAEAYQEQYLDDIEDQMRLNPEWDLTLDVQAKHWISAHAALHPEPAAEETPK